MTDHRFLTPDRNVQQNTFANGVTVNFGPNPHPLPDGAILQPLSSHVTGLPHNGP